MFGGRAEEKGLFSIVHVRKDFYCTAQYASMGVQIPCVLGKEGSGPDPSRGVRLMAGMLTATHAYNLFSLTMESRYGSGWRASVEPETIAMLADEIAIGFGGQAEGPTHSQSGGKAPTVWRFPDSSRARTGHFGLRREDLEEQAA